MKASYRRKRIGSSSRFAFVRQWPRIGHFFEPNDSRLDEDVLTKQFNQELQTSNQISESAPDTSVERWKRYLGHSQNDAIVIGWEVRNDFASLTFSHHDVARLASAISTHPDPWNLLKNKFPVTLTFCGLIELHVLRMVEHGVFQKVRSTVSNLARNFNDIGSIILIQESSDEITLAIEIRGERPFLREKPPFCFSFTNEYYLLIRAQSVSVEENYQQAWFELFGKEKRNILEAFEAVWPQPNWSMNEFDDWLSQIDGMEKAPIN